MRSVGLNTDAATGMSAMNVLSGLSDVVVCVLLGLALMQLPVYQH